MCYIGFVLQTNLQEYKEEVMATQDLDRVRYVTTNFNYLQGLVMMPVGLIFLAVAAMEAGWLQTRGWASIVGFGLALVLAWAAHQYYNRKFGRVKTVSAIPRNPNWAAIIAVWTLGLGLLIGAHLLDGWLHPPVILFGLTMAALTFAYYWPRRSFATHYLAIAGIIAVISLFPVLGVDATNPVFQPSIFSLIILGLFFAVGGLFDHLLLARTLKPVPEADDDQPI